MSLLSVYRRRKSVGYLAVTVALVVFGGVVASGGAALAVGTTASVAHVAPLITDVEGRDGELKVVITPGDTSTPVEQLTVTAQPLNADGERAGDPVTVSGTPDPDQNPPAIVVSGLANGTDYEVTATDTSAGVTSSESEPYFGTPEAAGAPLAPTLDSVFGRDQSLLVTWNPAKDGGSPVTGYTVTALRDGQPAAKGSAPGGATTATITGLSNDAQYTVSVTATNKAGEGSPGTSDDKTLGADSGGRVQPRPAYAPGPPEDVSAGPPPPADDGSTNNKALRVTWWAPRDDGGSAVTGYTVTASADGQSSVTTQVEGSTTHTALLNDLVPEVDYSVTVTAHNQVSPASPGRANAAASTSETATAAAGGQLRPEAVLLSQDSVRTITAVTPDTVTFTHPTNQVKDTLQPGKVLFIGEENNNPLTEAGLIRKVDKVVDDSGDALTLATTDGKIGDAVQEARIAAAPEESPGPTQIKSVDPRFRGAIKKDGDKWEIDIGKKINSDPKMKKKLKGATVTAKLEGELSVKPDWHASAGWKKDPRGFFYGPTFTFDFKATTTAKASVKGDIGIDYKYESEKKKVFEIKDKCAWVYVVAFCPKLSVYAQMALDGSIHFTFEASYSRTMGGELWRAADTSWHSKDLTTDPQKTFKKTLTAKATIAVSFPVSLEILIYNVVGPGLTVTPALVLTGDTSANPWLTLDFKLKVNVAFVVDLKVKRFDWNKDVYNGTFPLWNSGGPLTLPSLSPKGQARSVGSGPATHSARTGPDPLEITWPAGWPATCRTVSAWSLTEHASGSIDPNGVYTPPADITMPSVDEVVATTKDAPECPKDDQQRPVTVSMFIHNGPTTPGKPGNVTVSEDGRTISWDTPHDTGGADITKYDVVVEDDQADSASSTQYVLADTTGNSVTVPEGKAAELAKPGVHVLVVPFNSWGQGQTSVSVPVIPPPPPSDEPVLPDESGTPTG